MSLRAQRIRQVDEFALLGALEFAVFVRAHRVGGKTYRQIAEEEGVHPSTIRSYINWCETLGYGSRDDPSPTSNAVSLLCEAGQEAFLSARADKRYCSNACRQDAYRKRKPVGA